MSEKMPDELMIGSSFGPRLIIKADGNSPSKNDVFSVSLKRWQIDEIVKIIKDKNHG